MLNKKSIAVVGSRRCSEYGKNVALRIGKMAASNDIVLVSGMAAGIDRYGHEGCLMAGGKTIAVLGCGIDICYPGSNRNLYERIAENGLIISEFDLTLPPLARNFPCRNRIISGLSDKIIVVEAMTKSGSMITAELGIEQGKEVMAVPGNITSQYSLGTNKLIADGATIVAVVDDIFYDLRGEVKLSSIDDLNLSGDEKKIMEYIMRNGEVQIERLYTDLNIPMNVISGMISVLEIKGLISYNLGKVFII